jgi:hypothetical protein
MELLPSSRPSLRRATLQTGPGPNLTENFTDPHQSLDWQGVGETPHPFR